MTATTVAPAVWLDLIAGNVHVMQAADRIMEADGCERAAALATLHGAAADWVGNIDGSDWRVSKTLTSEAARLISRQRIDGAHRHLSILNLDDSDLGGAWLEYRNRLYPALAILRELQAIPGGE
jgi:hypothetical protein